MRTNNANRFATELTATMSDTALEASVTTTAGSPASPCYLVIDHDVAAKAEIILFDGTFDGTTFRTTALANRYLSGSAASSGITHDVGANVISAPLGISLNDIWDSVEANTSDHDAHQAAANPHSGSASDTELSNHTGASNPHSSSASTTDLNNHAADGTDVHGISDTSTLASDNQPAARVTKIDFTQNVSHDTAEQFSFFDVVYDTDNMTDDAISATSQPGYFTINTAGLYVITGSIYWENNATGQRVAEIRVNGIGRAAHSAPGAGNNLTGNKNNVTAQERLVVGDQVDLWVGQNSGGSLSIPPNADHNHLSIVRLSA